MTRPQSSTLFSLFSQKCRFHIVLIFCLYLQLCCYITATNAEPYRDNTPEDEIPTELRQKKSFMENVETMRKMWFLREIHPNFPVSPTTLFVLTMLTLNVYMTMGTYDWCEASHILLHGHDPKTKQQLEEWKKIIGSDYKKFQEYAREHSGCPSNKKGGSLGRFFKGDMAKQFDQCCFDARTPKGTTVGPIQTSFGWHLVFITNRSG